MKFRMGEDDPHMPKTVLQRSKIKGKPVSVVSTLISLAFLAKMAPGQADFAHFACQTPELSANTHVSA
jgi:hypothetical protein